MAYKILEADNISHSEKVTVLFMAYRVIYFSVYDI